MKATIVVAALLGLGASIPAITEPPVPADRKSFIVDLSGLADGVLETRNGGSELERRANCPNLQTCVGHRCVRLECMPIGVDGTTTTCITFIYGKC